MTNLVTVLGCGFVAYEAHMGDDLMVANAARVSFHKKSDWEEQDGLTFLTLRDAKLIDYLAKNNHWTPFAHPQITLRIKAPIFVRTQLFKHKVGLVENEVSRRYVTDAPTFYTPNWRTKPTGGAKQGSDDFLTHEGARESADRLVNDLFFQATKVYEALLDMGVAAEQARAALPQAAMTEWWWTGSLSAFARVVRQRTDPHAQWETREVAQAISDIIAPRYPVSWRALTESR
jgi:thymidylate synthase (FAD)